MFKRFRFLFVKELIQVLRDKRMRITLIFPPIFQLIVFGYAANLDVKNIRMALRDLDQTVESRDVMDRFRSSKYFKVVAYPQTPKEIEDLIREGERKITASPSTPIPPMALKVGLEHREAGIPMVCLETALPAKFEDAIQEALGRLPERPADLGDLETLPQRFEVMDASAQQVRAFVAAHAND